MNMDDILRKQQVKIVNGYEMRKQRASDDIIDLKILGCDMWKGFTRYWWLLTVICTITAIGCYLYQILGYVPKYKSSTSFSVMIQTSYNEADPSYGYSYSRSTSDYLSDVFPHIYKTSVLSDMVKAELGIDKLNVTRSLEAIGESNLFVMSVTSKDPDWSKQVLELMLEYFPEVAKYVVGEIRINIIDPPTFPVTPVGELTSRKAIVAGVLIGSVIGFVFLVIYGITRKTVRTEAEVEELLNISCLGVLPRVHFRASKSKTDKTISVYNEAIGQGFIESIRSCSMKLIRKLMVDQEKVILVTSALPGEGKTTISCVMAETFAKRGCKVLLIDGDLKKPTLYRRVQIKDKIPQLSDVLGDNLKWSEAICDCSEKGIDCLGNRTKYRNSLQLLSSESFVALIQEAKAAYDYIIIDTPPCGSVADAAAVTGLVDQVLFVVRQDNASQSQVMDALYNINVQSGIKIDGILNGVEKSVAGYGYYHGGYYGRHYGGKYGNYSYRKYGVYGNDGKSNRNRES